MQIRHPRTDDMAMGNACTSQDETLGYGIHRCCSRLGGSRSTSTLDKDMMGVRWAGGKTVEIYLKQYYIFFKCLENICYRQGRGGGVSRPETDPIHLHAHVSPVTERNWWASRGVAWLPKDFSSMGVFVPVVSYLK